MSKNNRSRAYSDKQRANAAASKSKFNINKPVPPAITPPATPEPEQTAPTAMPEENAKTPEVPGLAVELAQQAEEIRKLQSQLEEERQKIEQVRREQAEKCKKLEEKEKRLNERENELDEQSGDLNRQKQLQDKRQSTLKQQETMLDERTAHITEQEDKLSIREKKLHDAAIAADQEILQRKEQAENAAVQMRAAMMEDLRTEVAAARESQMKQADADVETYAQKRYAALEAELEKKRDTQTEELNAKLESLRAAQMQELEKERADWEQQKAEAQRALDDKRAQNEKKEKELDKREDDLEEKEDNLEKLQNTKEQMPERIKQAEERVRRSMQYELNVAEETRRELKERLEAVEKQLTGYQSFEETWGGKPDVLKLELKQRREENIRYKEKINSLPSLGLKDELKDEKERNEQLVSRCKMLEEQNKIFKQDAAELQELRENKEKQEHALRSANLERDIASKENEELKQKLSRYLQPEAQKQERDERVKELSIPYRTNIPKQDFGAQPKSELAWLRGIEQQCKDYGIVFPTRLLYAFHTALKIADWSSITILSGISGTGKSELPRLYARFGGINFYMASVQPNWDSQEAMLGYFNSIDNRFEATDLLRFLVQSVNRGESNSPVTDKDGQPQKDAHGKPRMKLIPPSQEPWPLGVYMSIVLLDEMNLAHVEHYFAEFLSKLESRRGLILDDVPAINVNLGAGCEPYKLYLRRNVLWVGTMNQDETTKTLSDKVLDRSITITFPTPKTLESRPRMAELPSEACDHMLSYQTWHSWCNDAEPENEEFQKQMKRYRKIIEALNEEMGKSGRAVGHRVWQSIEHYITNYPLVTENSKEKTEGVPMSAALRNAMDMAFEDQLVQKIMPKLRGIENNGSGAEQLDRIWMILSDAGLGDLRDDFNRARQYGYGEFFWNSAEYMKPIDMGGQPEENAGKTEQTADAQA